jgi:hypothetical protein
MSGAQCAGHFFKKMIHQNQRNSVMANSKTTVWQHAFHAISSKLGFVQVSEADAATLIAANVAQRPKIGAYRFKKLNRATTITSGIGASGAPFIEGGTFTFTITLSAAASEDCTFVLSVSGTAVESVDYEPLPAQVTVPAGQLSVAFPLVTIARDGAQGSRNVAVEIETYEDFVTISGASASIAIIDA